MASNPFRPYPKGHGFVKLLLYGDPGTMKTRRALSMPGPRYMVDMELGADEYGDLTGADDQYFPTDSHTGVVAALDYLDSLEQGAVGTLIIDPITVVWASLQVAHIDRVARQKRTPPEQVIVDTGAWARLNRVHGDIMSRLLAAPYHVVMIARGKALRDDAGRETGYTFEGNKSLEYLAKTVVQTRVGGDTVIKDRSGTLKVGQRNGRVDIGELVAAAGTRTTTAREEHESWADHRSWFMAQLGDLGLTYAVLATWCDGAGKPRPSEVSTETRHTMLAWAQSNQGREALGLRPIVGGGQ